MTNTTIIICSLILLVIGILLERNSKIKKLEKQYKIIQNEFYTLGNKDWLFKHYNDVKNMTFKQQKLFFKMHPGYIYDIDSMGDGELKECIDDLLYRQKHDIDSFIKKYDSLEKHDNSENNNYKLDENNEYTIKSYDGDSIALYDEFIYFIHENIDTIKDKTISMEYKTAYDLYTIFNIPDTFTAISNFVYDEENEIYIVTYCNKFNFEIFGSAKIDKYTIKLLDD